MLIISVLCLIDVLYGFNSLFPLRVQDVIAIIGKLMIAIFVVYIHHKIFLAQFENLGSVVSFRWRSMRK